MSSYVEKSLELHLFFGRIMKEHSLFLRASFTPADPSFSQKAERFLKEFEAVLSEAVRLSDGVVRAEVLNSGEVVTEFTMLAENQTECFTAIPIDRCITERELRLCPGKQDCSRQLRESVRCLNRTALNLLDGLISFKETVLRRVLQGKMFTLNYPLLIEHIIREAKLYRQYLQILERDGELPDRLVRDNECFWNQIMMEHAEFIRGLLDPSEEELLETANGFAEEYCKLLETCRNSHSRTVCRDALAQTRKFRDFKAAGTQGIQQNKIRSIILPLLADHVLREANHYLRLLESKCGGDENGCPQD